MHIYLVTVYIAIKNLFITNFDNCLEIETLNSQPNPILCLLLGNRDIITMEEMCVTLHAHYQVRELLIKPTVCFRYAQSPFLFLFLYLISYQVLCNVYNFPIVKTKIRKDIFPHDFYLKQNNYK